MMKQNHTTSITKSKGLEIILEGYTPAVVETATEATVQNSLILTAVKTYHQLIGSLDDPELNFAMTSSSDHFSGMILTPPELLAFQYAAFSHETRECPSRDRCTAAANAALNSLMMNSYRAGHNNFTLDAGSYQDHGIIPYFMMQAEEDNPLRITLLGSYQGIIYLESSHVRWFWDGKFNVMLNVRAGHLNCLLAPHDNHKILNEIRSRRRENLEPFQSKPGSYFYGMGRISAFRLIHVRDDGSEEEVMQDV